MGICSLRVTCKDVVRTKNLVAPILAVTAQYDEN